MRRPTWASPLASRCAHDANPSAAPAPSNPPCCALASPSQHQAGFHRTQSLKQSYGATHPLFPDLQQQQRATSAASSTRGPLLYDTRSTMRSSVSAPTGKLWAQEWSFWGPSGNPVASDGGTPRSEPSPDGSGHGSPPRFPRPVRAGPAVSTIAEEDLERTLATTTDFVGASLAGARIHNDGSLQPANPLLRTRSPVERSPEKLAPLPGSRMPADLDRPRSPRGNGLGPLDGRRGLDAWPGEQRESDGIRVSLNALPGRRLSPVPADPEPPRAAAPFRTEAAARLREVKGSPFRSKAAGPAPPETVAARAPATALPPPPPPLQPLVPVGGGFTSEDDEETVNYGTLRPGGTPEIRAALQQIRSDLGIVKPAAAPPVQRADTLTETVYEDDFEDFEEA